MAKRKAREDRDVLDLLRMVELLMEEVDILKQQLKSQERHHISLHRQIERYRRKFSMRIRIITGLSKYFKKKENPS